MQDLLGAPVGVFIGLTVVLAGGAALLTGRAIAQNWKPAWQVVLACIGLALADRFLVFALFDGELLSLYGFLVHYIVILILGLVAWQTARVAKLVNQYPWRYQRSSLFGYVEKSDG